MNEREFCYWLQGLLELSDVETLDENQVQMIREHLALVFNKVTPTTYDQTPTLINPIMFPRHGPAGPTLPPSPYLICSSSQTFCLKNPELRTYASC